MRGTSSRGVGLGPGVTTTTQIISGQSGLRHSLRGSGSGKVWKKTVLGKKYEFAEKLREKKNYIMYHSGMGHEKNVIEEIEKIPEQEKIVEERQLIDNYGYYESKDLKKKRDPNKLSITRHQRLSSPFERTVVKKFGQNNSNPTKSYISSTINNSRFTSGVGGVDDILGKYNSYTSKQENNITVEPSRLYETYNPSKQSKSSSSYTKTIISTTRSRAPVTTTVKEYTSKTIKSSGKPTITTSKYLSSSNTSKYLPKYVPTINNYETQNRFLDTQTKTETTDDYLTNIATTKGHLGGDYGSSLYTSSKEEISRPTYLETLNAETKTRESPIIDLPSSNGITAEYGATETKVEEKTKTYEDDKLEDEGEEIREDERDDRNERIEREEREERIERDERVERDERPKTIEHSEYRTTNYNLGYGDSLYRPSYGNSLGYGYGYGPRPELGPGPLYDLGPRPTLGPMPISMPLYGTYSQGTYGVFRHKPTCPLYEGNLYRMRAELQSQESSGYDKSNNSFSGIKREYSEVKKFSSTGSRGGSVGSGGRAYGNTVKKSSKSGGRGSSKYTYTKITTTTTGTRERQREGKNYNYYESKDIKKKKKNKPITTLGGITSLSTISSNIAQKYQRSTSHKSKGYQSSNLNSISSIIKNINVPKVTIGLTPTQRNFKNTFKLVSNKTKKSGTSTSLGKISNLGKSSSYNKYSNIGKISSIGKTSNVGKVSSIGKSSNIGKTTSITEIRSYEQRGKTSDSSYNDYRGDGTSGGESKYEYKSEYVEGGPKYEENYEYTRSINEYNRYGNDNKYGYGGYGGDFGGFSSQYQYTDDSEYQVVFCPIHGKQTIRRRRNFNFY